MKKEITTVEISTYYLVLQNYGWTLWHCTVVSFFFVVYTSNAGKLFVFKSGTRLGSYQTFSTLTSDPSDALTEIRHLDIGQSIAAFETTIVLDRTLTWITSGTNGVLWSGEE